MTPTQQLRLEALKLSVATSGNSNKTDLAETYVTFLKLDDGEPAVAQVNGGQQQGKGGRAR